MSGKPSPEELNAKKWFESQIGTDILDRIDGEGASEFGARRYIAAEFRRLSWMIGEKKGIE